MLTSRSTRGRNAIASSARRLRRSVVSVSVAADDVVPVVLVEILPRLGDDLVQVAGIAGCRRGVVDRGGLVGAILHDEPIELEKSGGTCRT